MKSLLVFLTFGTIFMTSQTYASSDLGSEELYVDINSSQDKLDNYIHQGHHVVEDKMIWTCPLFTDEEKDEIDAYKGDVGIELTYGASVSCVLRNDEGQITVLSRRKVMPGSKLVTYDSVQNLSTLQEWVSKPGPIKTYSTKTSSIQLPTIIVIHLSRSWSGDPSSDPLK